MTNFASAADKDKFIQILKEFGSTLLFFFFFLVGMGCLLNWYLPRPQIYTCDMEQVVQWKSEPHFVHQGYHFGDGHLQSNEKSHHGKFSAKTGNSERFALAHTYANLTGNEMVRITAWRHCESGKNGKIVISVPNKILWAADAEVIERSPDGWEQIQLIQPIPKKAKNKSLSIYLWNPSKEIVYFDDLTVQIAQNDKM